MHRRTRRAVVRWSLLVIALALVALFILTIWGAGPGSLRRPPRPDAQGAWLAPGVTAVAVVEPGRHVAPARSRSAR